MRHGAERARHAPAREHTQGLTKIADAWDTPQQEQVLNEVYPTLPKISIDYAVMEPAIAGQGQGAGGRRRDAGAVARRRLLAGAGRDARRPTSTTTPPTADHVFLDSDDNIIVSHDPKHLVSLIGVSDMIVVHTKDATMVCPKNEAQRVKELVAKVKERFGTRYL